MQKYYDEKNVDSCFNSILELKQQAPTGLDTTTILEKFKPALLELLEAKITVKMIADHFHTHDVKIPKNILAKYISALRPKKKIKRVKSTQKATTQEQSNDLMEKSDEPTK